MGFCQTKKLVMYKCEIVADSVNEFGNQVFNHLNLFIMRKLFLIIPLLIMIGLGSCVKEPLPEPTYKLSFILMWNNKLYYNDVAYNTPYAVKNQKVNFICTKENNEHIVTSGISNDEGKITFELPSKIRFFDISFMIPKGTVLVAPIVVDGDIVTFAG